MKLTEFGVKSKIMGKFGKNLDYKLYMKNYPEYGLFRFFSTLSTNVFTLFTKISLNLCKHNETYTFICNF